jgi:2-dehydro-3-deoxyphosphogluconate aldolase/(4S)-4-hydroxy-2-oxoglutarate aldolase
LHNFLAMENQFGIRNILRENTIIPVVNIENVDHVESILAKLQEQGINCIEITLRSACAMEAIEKAMAIRPEGFSVGVGTIVVPSQVQDCAKLGVDFMVSPGLSSELISALNEAQLPFLPGVMTPSEIIRGLNQGWNTFKLFPFNLAGGITALKTYSGVFPNVTFCPTGGLNSENYKACLELDNVMSVGGSWVLK